MKRGEFVKYGYLDDATRALVDAARDVATRAYAPFSGFQVGAALRCATGSVIAGCNVESSSYGGTICAERGAILSAVAQGEREFQEIAIWCPTDEPSVPCGLCCQLLAEFEPKLRLWIACRGDAVRKTTLDTFFPEPFLFGRE